MKLHGQTLIGVAVVVAAFSAAARADDLAADAAPADAAETAGSIRALLADPQQLASWLRDRDPQFDAARARIEASLASGQQARVIPNPQLTFGVGGITLVAGNASTGPTGLRDTTNFAVGVGELVEIGKREPRRRAADFRTQEAREAALGTLGGRVSDATTTLGKLAYVVARHDVVSANLEASRKLQASEKTRLDNKDMSGADFARIELDTQELELQLGRADADVAVSVASCSSTLAARCSPTGLDSSALDSAAPLPAALPGADVAIAGRPIRQASKLEVTALGQDAVLAEHRKIPDPTFGVGYTFDNFAGDLPQAIELTVGIALPVFDTGKHDAAAARANAHATEAQDRADIRTAHGTVEALTAQLGVLRTTLERLEKESVPKSALIVTEAKRAFDLGETGIAELLLAERSHRDLLLEVLDTRFDLFNIRAQLRQELGLDDEAARTATRSK